ncbi:protein of unknown function (plasmid) [Cupriavidus taiwanensis]|uniref:Uncharacterized protein n=1 Tax=Cupriavidus taiwanensis TaxID=164546 RepID=A0A375IST0_9BURK|nr:protein of unknown function [Cupriavidus taiwanensis]
MYFRLQQRGGQLPAPPCDSGLPLSWHGPLFGLDNDVFSAMGLLWAELQAGYRMVAYV